MEQDMKMWQKEVINVGEVPEKAKVEVQFLYTGNCIPFDVKLSPSCGCTSVRWIPENRVLTAVLNVGTIPKHLKDKWEVSKSIKMQYICDGIETKDVLIIKATVVKS